MIVDIKELLIKRIEGLRAMNETDRGHSISDIVDSLLSSRVSVTMERSGPQPMLVPECRNEADLVSNNID